MLRRYKCTFSLVPCKGLFDKPLLIDYERLFFEPISILFVLLVNIRTNDHEIFSYPIDH